MRLVPRLVAGTVAIVAALGVALVIVTGARAREAQRALEEDRLAGQARLVAAWWTAGGTGAAVARTAAATLEARVTLIGPDGVPVGDSEGTAAASPRERLDNRPEVAAALRGQRGTAERADGAKGERRLYVAVAAGALGAVRVDRPLDAVLAGVEATRTFALAAALAAIALAALLSFLLAGRIAGPIVELRDTARALAGGDLARRPALSGPGEVGELASAMHRLAEALGARAAQYAAEDALVDATLEALHEGVVAVGPRGEVVRMNETARRLLGVRDALPFPSDLLPRDRALREALAAALAGTPTELVETTLGERILALAARPLAPGGAVLAVLDLSAQRRLETIRRDFVANVSHELKTPLTVVGGYADTLLDPDLPATMRAQFVETIRAHATRMQRIVDDLLDLSRIESGGWIPAPVLLDLAAMAPEATAVAAEKADRQGVTLDIALGERELVADATAVRQILSNLADNAVRHTAAGRITVFTEAGDGGTWLGVRDTGSGIPAEHLPRIFERFYRVDPGRSREQGGTGLGLSIVRHLVEAHGGRVRAESTVGVGTTIACWFPSPTSRGA